jgi:23S rRNA (uracil1939-C5)-methyltransferase
VTLPPPLRRNDLLDVRIESIAYGGAGVAHVPPAPGLRDPADDGMLVFTPKGAAPGDLVRVAVVKVRRRPPQLAPPPGEVATDVADSAGRPAATTRQTMNAMDRLARGRAYVQVEFEERLDRSPDSVEPRCKHFGVPSLGGGSCGGCVSMDVEYGRQITEKQAQVEALFTALGDYAPIVGTFVPCESIYNFRNKMEFSYGRKWHLADPRQKKEEIEVYRGTTTAIPGNRRPGSRKRKQKERGTHPKIAPLPIDRADREYALGMHAGGRYDKVVEVSECHIQHPVANDILALVRARCIDQLLMPYDCVDGSGYIRNVAIRSAINSAGNLEMMVNFHTNPDPCQDLLLPLATELRETFPSIVCVVQNMPDSAADVNNNHQLQRILGGSRSYIEQQLCGLTFHISPNSFFQSEFATANLCPSLRGTGCL